MKHSSKKKHPAAKPKALRKPASARVTRADEVKTLLARENGVRLDELMAKFKWLAHTTRAFLSVLNRKQKLGMKLVDGRYIAKAKERD